MTLINYIVTVPDYTPGYIVTFHVNSDNISSMLGLKFEYVELYDPSDNLLISTSDISFLATDYIYFNIDGQNLWEFSYKLYCSSGGDPYQINLIYEDTPNYLYATVSPPITQGTKVVAINLQGGGKASIPIVSPVSSQKSVVMKLQSGEKVAVSLRTPKSGDRVAIINLQGGGKVAALIGRNYVYYENIISIPCVNTIGGPDGDFQYGKINITNEDLETSEYMRYFADAYLRLEGADSISIKYKVRTYNGFCKFVIGDKTINFYDSPYSNTLDGGIMQNPSYPGFDTIIFTADDIGPGSQRSADPSLFWYSYFQVYINPKAEGETYFANLELGPITPVGENTNSWDHGVIRVVATSSSS